MERRELLKLTKIQLIKRCKKSKLPTNGTKGDLVNRLISKSSSKKTNNKTTKKKNTTLKPKKKHVRHSASTGALHFKSKKKKSNAKQKKFNVKKKKSNVIKKKSNVKQKKSNIKQKKSNIKQKTSNVKKTKSNVKQKKFKIKKIQTYNTEIMTQLTQFNYDRTDILTAINNVIDKNDINSIMNYIDTKIKVQPEEIKHDSYNSDSDSSLSMLSIADVGNDQYSNNQNLIDNETDDDDEPKPSTPSDHSSVGAETILSTVSNMIEDEKKVMYAEEKNITTEEVFKLNNISLDMTLVQVDNDDIFNLLSPSKQVLTPSKRPNCFSKTPRVPNKFQIVQDLKEMGFKMDRILRAFKVYEKNYGTKYNTNGLIELITRLKLKDDANNKITEEKINMIHYDMNIFNKRNKSRKSNAKKMQMSPRLFVSHMSLVEAEKLCLFDNIDHRDFTGKFCIATIIDIDSYNTSNVKIHYEDDFNDKYDVWSDYKIQLFRFAGHRSISRSKQYLFNDELKLSDHVNVKPHKFYMNESILLELGDKRKWFDGIVTAFDKKSAQIQVSHQNCVKIDQSNRHAKWFIYWTHIDNIQEVSKYSAKSLLPSSFYTYTQHQKQSASLGSLNINSVFNK